MANSCLHAISTELEAWYFGAGEYRKRIKEIHARNAAEQERARLQDEADQTRQKKRDFLRGIFSKVDDDNSGHILISEVARLIENTFGQKLSPPQLKAATQAMDPSATGKVNFNEFVQWSGRPVSSNSKHKIEHWWVVAMDQLSKAGGDLNVRPRLLSFYHSMTELLCDMLEDPDTACLCSST